MLRPRSRPASRMTLPGRPGQSDVRPKRIHCNWLKTGALRSCRFFTILRNTLRAFQRIRASYPRDTRLFRLTECGIHLILRLSLYTTIPIPNTITDPATPFNITPVCSFPGLPPVPPAIHRAIAALLLSKTEPQDENLYRTIMATSI